MTNESTTKRADTPMLLKLMRAGVREDQAWRAIDEKDITDNDIEWNGVLGRPANFVETVEPEVEQERRRQYLRLHPEVKLKP